MDFSLPGVGRFAKPPCDSNAPSLFLDRRLPVPGPQDRWFIRERHPIRGTKQHLVFFISLGDDPWKWLWPHDRRLERKERRQRRKTKGGFGGGDVSTKASQPRQGKRLVYFPQSLRLPWSKWVFLCGTVNVFSQLKSLNESIFWQWKKME